jgi:hypothetical protein
VRKTVRHFSRNLFFLANYPRIYQVWAMGIGKVLLPAEQVAERLGAAGGGVNVG